jgi:hypothetical protein
MVKLFSYEPWIVFIRYIYILENLSKLDENNLWTCTETVSISSLKHHGTLCQILMHVNYP